MDEVSAAAPRFVPFFAAPAAVAALLAGRVLDAFVALAFGIVAFAMDAVVGTTTEGLSGEAIDGFRGDAGRAMKGFAGLVISFVGEGKGNVRELFDRGEST